LHFPSIDALKAAATSTGGQEEGAYAISISTGGTPIILIAEEETITF